MLAIERYMADDINLFIHHNLQRYAIENHPLLTSLSNYEIEKIISRSVNFQYRMNDILIKKGEL